MKMSIRRLVVGVAVVALAVTGGLALAQGTPPRPQNGPGAQMMQRPGGPMMLGRLNLTDQQRSQVQALQQQHRAANQELMQKMRDLQGQLRAAIFADNGPDEARVTQLQQQIAQIQPQMQQARIEMEVGVAKILTPEQRKQLREMPMPGPGGRGRGMGRGMRHPQGWM